MIPVDVAPGPVLLEASERVVVGQTNAPVAVIAAQDQMAIFGLEQDPLEVWQLEFGTENAQ
jgi:hypothetical protein